ncbi:hypothetical protein H310_04459 [Aphanomyces invadans]|uniref:FAD-binding PCMH-type domain-containing protein n=1 Tax=Aphanomyces invadans TaxID=157072 RepID=A0A024UCV0_9STRA|nr:hypothetical protein H310_04459 [Aphanomyces invadans]ETW04094.1 hypothetical protein H310_04459 [Aphanomyces invadans]|eukprot:XP_008867050.1 hypothetical protein H310_04459 [Aphanomyces invadans]
MAALMGALTVASQSQGDIWSNWDTRQVCRPQVHVSPSTLAALQHAVESATHIRVAGAGHSFSPIVLTKHTLVTLEKYTKVVSFDNDTITVQAGRPLYAINDYLAARGRALPNLGAVAVQTAAGVTQTGTHGTGNTGCISDNIVAMDLVLANGSLVTLASGDFFDAARVGMGTLGAVSTLTFRHVPLWTMEQITFMLPLATFESHRAALLATFDRVQWYLLGLPTHSTVTVVLRVNTTAPISTGCWANVFTATPVTPLPLNWTAWPADTKACVDHSYKVLGRDGRNNTNYFTEMEMMLPVEDDAAALSDMLALHATLAPLHDPAVPLFLGFRYVNADKLWLSPFYGRRTVVVSTIVYHRGKYEPEIDRYHRGMQAALAKYGARPHTGKANYFTANDMARVHPKFHEFVALQKAVDPHGKFLNKYMRRLLVETEPTGSLDAAVQTSTTRSPLLVLTMLVACVFAVVHALRRHHKHGYERI